MRGLSEMTARELLSERNEVWVRLLHSDHRAKAKAPAKLLSLEGGYAVVLRHGDDKPIRIQVNKLETAPSPHPRPQQQQPLQIHAKPLLMQPIAVTPAPQPVAVAPSVEIAPVVESEPPVNPRDRARIRKQEMADTHFVIFDRKSSTFYTAAHRWSTSLGVAREYALTGANKAAGRLQGKGGKGRGRDLMVMPASEAKETLERLLAPKEAAAAGTGAAAPEKPKTLARELLRPPAHVADAFAAWRDAAMAEAHARAEALLRRTALDLMLEGQRLGL